MSGYRFLTRFVVTCPPAPVYAAVLEPERWLADLDHVRVLERVNVGDDRGIGDTYRTVVGAVPYRLRWWMEVVETEPDTVITWAATGDLTGRGSWTLAKVAPGTLVTSRWHVRATRWWMRLATPIARPLFVHNHDRVMRAGARRLAEHLDAELVSFSSEQEPRPGRARRRRARRR